MPILPSAKKTLRSSKRKATVNQGLKSKARTTIKKTKTEPTVVNMQQAFSAVDKCVKKNLFHRNRAARIKSQLAKLVAERKDAVEVKKSSKTSSPAKTKKAKTTNTEKKATNKKTQATSKKTVTAKKPAAKKSAAKKTTIAKK